MKILVCGGRHYDNRRKLNRVLEQYRHVTDAIIHGDATGADRMAGDWARHWGIKEIKYPADWNKYGNKAGYIRNSDMLKYEMPDLVIAFTGGKGTDMMIKLAEQKGVKVIRVNETPINK